MAKASIREAIQTLSNILSSCGAPKVPSEVFRQAKFDNPSVVEELWTIVCHSYELIQQKCLLHGRGRPIKETLFTSGDHDKLQRKWMKWQVKRFASRQGYARSHRLVEGEESSRELLILFGWLLQKYRVIPRLRQTCLHELTTVPALPPQYVDQIESATADLQHELCRIEEALESNVIDKCLLQQLVMLRGGMNMRGKRLSLTVNNYRKLVEQIHQYTHDPQTGGKDLTLHDLYLLRHPHLIAQHEKHLGERLAMLGGFVEWQQLEDVFWKWMNSVLELADKGREVREPTLPTRIDRVQDHSLASRVHDLISEANTLIGQNSYHLSYLNDLITRAKVRLLPHEEELYLEEVLLYDFQEERAVAACNVKGLSCDKLTWDGPFLMNCHTGLSSDECKALQERIESTKQLIVKQARYFGELVPDSMAI